MAKPSPDPLSVPRLLVLELWGLGDLALAMPFLREATAHARVTLLAKPHARALLARFAPEVELVTFIAPWTAFRGKYRLHAWPWRELLRIRRELRGRRFDLAASARYDPRDHAVMTMAGAARRIGFPRRGSRILLTDPLVRPTNRHRAEHWRTLAARLGWPIGATVWPSELTPNPRRIVLHAGAAHPSRRWPRERFVALAERLGAAGWQPEFLNDASDNLADLLHTLAGAARFIGNDSGPGHLAALFDVPTFTLFGPSLPGLFSPVHPRAAWIEGGPCAYRPCWDYCRFPAPHCIQALSVDTVWTAVEEWLKRA